MFCKLWSEVCTLFSISLQFTWFILPAQLANKMLNICSFICFTVWFVTSQKKLNITFNYFCLLFVRLFNSIYKNKTLEIHNKKHLFLTSHHYLQTKCFTLFFFVLHLTSQQILIKKKKFTLTIFVRNVFL